MTQAHAPNRFVIVGLPRSGTTYLQTMLNAHPGVFCRGESFDAWQIDDAGHKTTDAAALLARDSDPGAFLDDRLALRDGPHGPLEAVGIKILFQHNPALFSHLIADRPDIGVILVWRANKLAQFASERHAKLHKEWTRTTKGAPYPPLDLNLRWIIEETQALQTRDHLLQLWLKSLPNPTLHVEYRALFDPGWPGRVCRFLGVAPTADLASPLVKQGANTVLNRYANANEIAEYFTATGRQDWLGAEL